MFFGLRLAVLWSFETPLVSLPLHFRVTTCIRRHASQRSSITLRSFSEQAGGSVSVTFISWVAISLNNMSCKAFRLLEGQANGRFASFVISIMYDFGLTVYAYITADGKD